jgi:hypothetical protein
MYKLSQSRPARALPRSRRSDERYHFAVVELHRWTSIAPWLFVVGGLLFRLAPDPIEIQIHQREVLASSSFEMEEDHEDDCRKEAALERRETSRGRNPVATTTAVVNRILPVSSSTDLAPPTAASVQVELPFLVTHYLASFRPPRDESRTDPLHDPLQEAAVARIRKAATELADAFEALGAFGTAMRVRSPDNN